MNRAVLCAPIYEQNEESLDHHRHHRPERGGDDHCLSALSFSARPLRTRRAGGRFPQCPDLRLRAVSVSGRTLFRSVERSLWKETDPNHQSARLGRRLCAAGHRRRVVGPVSRPDHRWVDRGKPKRAFCLHRR